MPPLLALALPLLVPAAPPRMDADGIPLPAEAVCRLGSAKFRHSNSIDQMTVTRDGRVLVTIDEYTTTNPYLWGWEAATGFLRYRVPLKDVYTRNMSVVGNCIQVEDIAGANRLTVSRYDQDTGLKLGPPVIHTPIAQVGSVLSPDGKTLLCYKCDVVRRYGIDHTDYVITAHPVAGGKPVPVLHESYPADVQLDTTFAPDGRHIAVVPNSLSPVAPSIRVFDPNTGKLVRNLQVGGKFVNLVAFTPDGARVAGVVAGEEKNTLVVWDLADGRRRDLIVDPHRKLFARPVFSPDGRLVVIWEAVHFDLMVADTTTGRTLHTLHNTYGPAVFSPDSRTLYASSRDTSVVTRLDLVTGRVTVPEPREPMNLLRVSTTGLIFCDSYVRGPQVVAWDARTRAIVSRGRVYRASPGNAITILDVSRDGKWVIFYEKPVRVEHKPSTTFSVCDAATGVVRATCAGHTEKIELATFSPDGTRVYSMAGTERRAWDAATGLPVDDPAVEGFERDAVTSPDRRMIVQFNGGIASTSLPKDPDRVGIDLVECVTGKVRHSFRGHLGSIGGYTWMTTAGGGMAFFPDGRYLVTTSLDAPMFVWDVRGELSKPDAPPDAATLAAAWADLASDDAAAGFRAVRRLAHFPDVAVPFLRDKLPPVQGPTPAAVAALVAGLDAPGFADRERAEKELKALGELAGPALRAAVRGTPSAEVRARAGRLLARLDGPPGPDAVRAVRAVEAVEWMGTPGSKALLAAWAGGAAGARLTVEATAAASR